MEDIFKNEKLYNLRINEINKLMPQFGYNNGRWEENNNTFIYKTTIEGKEEDNIKITIQKYYDKDYYIRNIDINPLDPLLLLQLYDKLNKDIRNKYRLSNNVLNNVLSIIKHLVNAISTYEKGDYNASQIIDLYELAYFPTRDMSSLSKNNDIDVKDVIQDKPPALFFDYFNKYFSNNVKNQLIEGLTNHQKDLDLFPNEYKYAFLSQSDFDYKTSNGMLILELLKGKKKKDFILKYWYTIREDSNPFVNIKYEPDWWDRYDFEFKNDTCYLKYASDKLLNNKSFIIKYINKSNKNLSILDYIPDNLKNDSDVVNTFISKDYTKEEIESSINNDDVYLIGDELISLKSKLSSVKRRVINKTKDFEKEIKKRKQIDYELKQKKSQENGLFAEYLIYEYEKQKMIDFGREELIDHVKLVSKEISENEGYDIESIDPETNETIYIEVKSSEKSKFDNINISNNEYNKLKENPKNWKMYFISNIKDKKHDLYIKTGEELLNVFDFRPTAYVMKMKNLINEQANTPEDSQISINGYRSKGI